MTFLPSFLPLVVFAQGGTGTAGESGAPPLPEAPIKGFAGVAKVLLSAAAWLFWVLIFLAIIFVIVAAYRYLTSAGDPEKVRSASKTFIYAAVAIAVALLARGIPLLVADFLGVQFSLPD